VASRTGPGRVLWMFSLTAQGHTFDADDWQLVNSSQPYEGTKFQWTSFALSSRATWVRPHKSATLQYTPACLIRYDEEAMYDSDQVD
jgi:hypothetical protein